MSPARGLVRGAALLAVAALVLAGCGTPALDDASEKRLADAQSEASAAVEALDGLAARIGDLEDEIEQLSARKKRNLALGGALVVFIVVPLAAGWRCRLRFMMRIRCLTSIARTGCWKSLCRCVILNTSRRGITRGLAPLLQK